MPVCYRLSNNQRKDLLVRNTEIWIAIPAPEHEPKDVRAYVLRVIPEIEPEQLGRVELEQVQCCGGRGHDGGLTGMIGTIYVKERVSGPQFTWWVDAITIQLIPKRDAGHRPVGLRWASSVVVDGLEFPYQHPQN